MRWLLLTVLVVFFVYAKNSDKTENAHPDEHDKDDEADDKSIHKLTKVYGEANQAKAQEPLSIEDETLPKNDHTEKPLEEKAVEGSADENLVENSENNDINNSSSTDSNSESSEKSESVEGSAEENLMGKSSSSDKNNILSTHSKSDSSENSEAIEGSAEKDFLEKSKSNDLKNSAKNSKSVDAENSGNARGDAEEGMAAKSKKKNPNDSSSKKVKLTSSEKSKVVSITINSLDALPNGSVTLQKSISDTALSSSGNAPSTSNSDEAVNATTSSVDSTSEAESEQSEEVSSASAKTTSEAEIKKSDSDDSGAKSLKSPDDGSEPSNLSAASVPQSSSSSSANEKVSNGKKTKKGGTRDHSKGKPSSPSVDSSGSAVSSSSKRLKKTKTRPNSSMKSTAVEDSDSKSSEDDSNSDEDSSSASPDESVREESSLEKRVNQTTPGQKSEESDVLNMEGSADSPFEADPSDDDEVSTERDKGGYLKVTDGDSVIFEKSKVVSEESSNKKEDAKDEDDSGAEDEKNHEKDESRKNGKDHKQVNDERNEKKEKKTTKKYNGEKSQKQKESNKELNLTPPMAGNEKKDDDEKSDDAEDTKTADNEDKRVEDSSYGTDTESNDEAVVVEQKEKTIKSEQIIKSTNVDDDEEDDADKTDGVTKPSSMTSEADDSDEKDVTVGSVEDELEKSERANDLKKSDITTGKSGKLPESSEDVDEFVDKKDEQEKKQLQTIDESAKTEITDDDTENAGSIKKEHLIPKIDSAAKDDKIVIEYKSNRRSEIGKQQAVEQVSYRMTHSLSNTSTPLTPHHAHSSNISATNKTKDEIMAALDGTSLSTTAVDTDDMSSTTTTAVDTDDMSSNTTAATSMKMTNVLHKQKSTFRSSVKDHGSKHHPKLSETAKSTRKPGIRSVVSRNFNFTRRYERLKSHKGRFITKTLPKSSLTLHKESVHSNFPTPKNLTINANFSEISKIPQNFHASNSSKDFPKPKKLTSKKYPLDFTRPVKLSGKKASTDFSKPTELFGKNSSSTFPEPKTLPTETSSFRTSSSSATSQNLPSTNSSLDLSYNDIVLDQKLNTELYSLKANKHSKPKKQKLKKSSKISYSEFPRPGILPIPPAPNKEKDVNPQNFLILKEKGPDGVAMNEVITPISSNASSADDIVAHAEFSHALSPQPKPASVKVSAHPELFPANITVIHRKIHRYRKRTHRKRNRSPEEKLRRVIILEKPARNYDSHAKRLSESVETRGNEERLPNRQLLDFAKGFEIDNLRFDLDPASAILDKPVDGSRYERAKADTDIPNSPSVKTTALWQHVAASGVQTALLKAHAAETAKDKLSTPVVIEMIPEEVQGSLHSLNYAENLVEEQHQKIEPKHRHGSAPITTNGVVETSGYGGNAAVDDGTDSRSAGDSSPDDEDDEKSGNDENYSKTRKADRPVPVKDGNAYQMDCATEIDEKGDLCKEWADAGLCAIHKPTMFLFCRRTCLCVGAADA